MESILGITAHGWLKLLWDNKFRIDPPFWPKAILLTIRSTLNSFYCRKEEKTYGSKLQAMNGKPPVFILGHWRSGTTLLHNLLSMDPQFCYPNLFQVYNPYTFLYLEPAITLKLANTPLQKRPMDNMEVRFDSPAEDEFALAILSLKSPLLSWPFPRREAYYDRYLTFQDVAQDEIDHWKASLHFFYQKLLLKYQRQIIFKSPAHTARVKLLLEMFPEALFIHIHRNPYTVFLSTRRLYDTAIPGSYLQKPIIHEIDTGIIRRYQLMYQAFLEQRQLIPQKNFVEICFEEFEKDIVGTIEHIYKSLNLLDFHNLQPRLQNYVASIATYKKNVHPEIDSGIKQQISNHWRKSFEAWGYNI